MANGFMENRDKHESYAVLGFNRSYGHDMTLYGSDIKHDTVITMTLKHAETCRELNKDWIMGKGTIAEVEMSYSQFAEAISSFGMGDGVPVTLRYTEKDGRIASPNYIPKKEQFEKEFNEHLDGVVSESKNIRNEIASLFDEKASIGKKDREEILNKLDRLVMHIGSSTEFIYSQFNEQMEKTVEEAKNEVEAFVQKKLDNVAKSILSTETEDDIKDFLAHRTQSPMRIE